MSDTVTLSGTVRDMFSMSFKISWFPRHVSLQVACRAILSNCQGISSHCIQYNMLCFIKLHLLPYLYSDNLSINRYQAHRLTFNSNLEYPKLSKMWRASSALLPLMQYVTNALSLAGFAKPYFAWKSLLDSVSALLSSGTVQSQWYCYNNNNNKPKQCSSSY